MKTQVFNEELGARVYIGTNEMKQSLMLSQWICFFTIAVKQDRIQSMQIELF
jgi:hypothetical protein